MATSKNHWHTINVSKFPRRLDEQLLKVSAILSKSAFKNFEKKKPYVGKKKKTSITYLIEEHFQE